MKRSVQRLELNLVSSAVVKIHDHVSLSFHAPRSCYAAGVKDMYLNAAESVVLEPVERDMGVSVKRDITFVFQSGVYESVESVVYIDQIPVCTEEAVSLEREY